MKRTHSETVTTFDTLPDSAGVSDQVVADVFGVSRVTVWRWSRRGLLPAPSKRGGATRWSVGALRRAITATA